MFEEIILLNDLMYCCCRIGGLDEFMGDTMNMRIRSMDLVLNRNLDED